MPAPRPVLTGRMQLTIGILALAAGLIVAGLVFWILAAVHAPSVVHTLSAPGKSIPLLSALAVAVPMRFRLKSIVLRRAKILLYTMLLFPAFFTSQAKAQLPNSDQTQVKILILQAQTDQDSLARAHAVTALAEYGEDSVVRVLVKIAATDSDSNVHQAAISGLNDLAFRGYAAEGKSPWQRTMVYGSGIANYILRPASGIYLPMHEFVHAEVAHLVGAGVKKVSLVPLVISQAAPTFDPKKGYFVLKDDAMWNTILSAPRAYPGIGVFAYVIPKKDVSRPKTIAFVAAPYALDVALMSLLQIPVYNFKTVDSVVHYKPNLYGEFINQQYGASLGAGIFSPVGGDFHTIAKQLVPGDTKKACVSRVVVGFAIGAGISYVEHELANKNAARTLRNNNFALKLGRLLSALFGFNDRWAVLAGKIFLPVEILWLSYTGWHSGFVPMLLLLTLFKLLEFAIEDLTSRILKAKGRRSEMPTAAKAAVELLHLVPYLFLAFSWIQGHLIAPIAVTLIAAANHIRFDWPALFGNKLGSLSPQRNGLTHFVNFARSA
jgi:hypothetical protein